MFCCEMCESNQANLIGALGMLSYLRCRHCGWDQVVDTSELEEFDV